MSSFISLIFISISKSCFIFPYILHFVILNRSAKRETMRLICRLKQIICDSTLRIETHILQPYRQSSSNALQGRLIQKSNSLIGEKNMKGIDFFHNKIKINKISFKFMNLDSSSYEPVTRHRLGIWVGYPEFPLHFITFVSLILLQSQ